ncbi:class I adenylate-forming enzyme family protein [Pigmentiphaga litoralis]|uniref:class I adenylate-forming enzyme family protein n=1 Tax=Pigmentiphaga litoralis TaxID=516702 RepID=UPI003B427FE1
MTPTPDDCVRFQPFIDMIAGHAAAMPAHVAFRVEDRTLTWQTLFDRARSVARALMASGVRPGDRVALLGPPSLAYVACLFGIVTARACVVPLPASASADTLVTMLADCDARMLFVDPAVGDLLMASSVDAAASTRCTPVRFGDEGVQAAEFAAWHDQPTDDLPLPVALADDAFNIIYSSGTTGTPKGIVHLHGMRQRQAQRNGFGFGPHSRALLSTPMYSNTTLTPLLGSLAHGGECLLMRKFDAARFLALASQFRATHTMLVPIQYKRLLAHPDFATSDLSAFELSQSTGAPMDPALKRDILDRWPGRFLEVYGMTEGGVSCFLDGRAHPDKLRTVGVPVYDTDILLIDEAGQRIPGNAGNAAAPQVGEIVGRSPFMMAEYHNRPEGTAAIRWYDQQGRMFHRTGDIGHIDADGFVTLLDRSKDVIISGGNNIYAADLEAVLLRHEGVQDCAVIGVPSVQWDETPLALVVLRPGTRIDEATLRDWVNARLGKTQRVSMVEFRNDLPRSELGKLSKKALRAPYWAKAGA